MRGLTLFRNLILAGGAALFVGLLYFFIALPDVNPSNEKADAIIVLTGSDRRVERGFALLTANIAPRMFITGVYDKATRDHVFGSFSRLNKQLYGQYKSKIELGYEAENTTGNAIEAARWVAKQNPPIKRVRVVTARYHMPRALREFERTMPDVELVADPAFPDPFNKPDWYLTAKGSRRVALEYLKFLYSYVRPVLPEALQLERLPITMRLDKTFYKD